MRHQPRIAVASLGLLLAAGCACRADLGPELHVLGSMEEVGAVAVYQSGERHAFHELAHAILYQGTLADFERLAADPRPVPRCMGLYLLARSGKPQAEPILQRHLSDPEPVNVQIGCVGQMTTVGGFARRLLRSRDYLEFEFEKKPIWSPMELVADDVRLLGYDGAPLPPGGDIKAYKDDRLVLNAAGSIRKQLDRGAVALDAATVRRLGRDTGMPRWRVVKGLGRAGPHPAVRGFLLHRLGDEREDDLVRLVAASALTRDPADDAVAAVRTYQDAVSRWAADPAGGKRLVQHSEQRALVDGVLREASIDPSGAGLDLFNRRDPGLPPVAERARGTLLAASSPALLDLQAAVAAALDDEGDDLYGGSASDDRSSDWLYATAGRLHEHRAPWDTYSDAVHALVAHVPFRLGSGMFGDGPPEKLDPDDARFEANVRAALESLEGDRRVIRTYSSRLPRVR